MRCISCQSPAIDKGRNAKGYRCRACGTTWSNGRQGRKSAEVVREGDQFHDTGDISVKR